jgi:hypothetical protein
VGEGVDQLLGDPVGEVVGLLVARHVDERQHRDGRRCGRFGPRRLAQHEEIDDARRCRAHSEREHDRGEPPPAPLAGRHALDAPLLHVERPGQRDHDRKADRQRHHYVGEHRVGPVQPVHHRLDDLKDREGGDAVGHQGADHAPALQLGEELLHPLGAYHCAAIRGSCKAGARPSAGRRGHCRRLRVTSSSFANLSLPKLDHEAGSRHIRFDGRHRPQEDQLLTFSPSFHSDALARLADDRAVSSWSYC